MASAKQALLSQTQLNLAQAAVAPVNSGMAVGEALTSTSAQHKRASSKTPQAKKGLAALKSSAGFLNPADDKVSVHGGATIGIGGVTVNLENI